MMPSFNPSDAAVPAPVVRRHTISSASFGFSLLLTTLVALVLVAGRVPEALISRVAYAVEAGQVKADSEHLVKADEISNAFRLVAKAARSGVVQIRVKGSFDHELMAKLEAQDKKLRQKISKLRDDLKGLDDPHSSPQFDELTDAQEELVQLENRIRRELAKGGEASGSGVVLDKAGYILTNNHVIDGGGEMEVALADKRIYKAKLVGTDPKTDLAVVKIEAADLQPLPLGDSDRMEVGDWVIAVGAPFGLSNTVTHGIISAKGRTDINTGREITYQDFLQTDAPINPGNSGGPLLNLRGEVIGINTAIATTEGVNSGVAFTIPSNQAAKIVHQLRDNGEVARGWLGISMGDISTDDAQMLGLPDPNGVMVDLIFEGSPAEKAGVQVEDVILRLNHNPVDTLAHLRGMIADIAPGDKVVTTVWRDGAEQELTITLDRQPANVTEYRAKTKSIVARPLARLGLEARTMRPNLPATFSLSRQPADLIRQALAKVQTAGIYVTEKFSDRLDVKPGEMIVGLNDTQVRSITELQKALKKVDDKQENRFDVVTADGDHRTVVEKR